MRPIDFFSRVDKANLHFIKSFFSYLDKNKMGSEGIEDLINGKWNQLTVLHISISLFT
jgi:hypothetical protein